MQVFKPEELKKLKKRSEEPENGQVTIIGGSDLFHGAPILALKTASRIVDMVYFSSPESSLGRVAEHLKSQLSSFIWVPWDAASPERTCGERSPEFIEGRSRTSRREVDAYIAKSNAVLIGPGMKRWHRESEKLKVKSSKLLDRAGTETKFITYKLLRQFPKKKWVIDGGALQVMDARWIPEGAILTPNKIEFEMLFNIKNQISNIKNTNKKSKIIQEKAKEYKCTIVYKAPETIACSQDKCLLVKGGNNGLTKGGTGDVLAGLTVALFAQNPALLAATAASWAVKKAADELYKKVGTLYNADDLAEEIPKVLGKYL